MNKNLTKDYGSSSDRATDVLKTMKGDCTEHALLATALLRNGVVHFTDSSYRDRPRGIIGLGVGAETVQLHALAPIRRTGERVQPSGHQDVKRHAPRTSRCRICRSSRQHDSNHDY